MLAQLANHGRLRVDDADIAAEQLVWLVTGAPLNRLSLNAASHPPTADQLQHVADEAVSTFLSRYAPEAPPELTAGR